VQRLNEFSLAAESRLQTFARESESKMQTWMRDAETSRLDQLSDLRQTYESRIADMLSESVKSTSSLVSTQLVQIQSTFDARVSKLEEFRLLSTGRSSVADPQLASSLSMLSNGITDMQKAFNKTLEELTAKQTKAMEELARNVASLKTSGTADEGRLMGRSDIGKWIVSALIAGSAFAAILGFILKFVGTVPH
jgi:exonuclease VII large subunit